ESRAVEILEAVRRDMDWDRPLPPDRGRGVALGVRHVGGGALPLRVVVSADGQLTVLTGMPEQGAGAWQVMRRVLAAVAGVDESRVSVRHTSTAGGPPDPGVGGSRVTHLASRAAEDLGRQVRDWLEERIPSVLPTAGSGTRLHDDELSDPDVPGPRIGFAEAVSRLVPGDAPIELSATFDGAAHGPDEPGDYDFAACAVEVEVDRATGAFRLTDALLAVDIGTVVNPVAHRGQLEGGFVFGLGAAVMEELPVDNGAVTALSLADVKLPNVGDVPPLRLALLSTDVGPGAFGAKMAGELTNTVVPPAVANAVADAVGARITELPISAERVHDALGGSR
ncbi:MAG TPA: molybdopterin cofactor-binding domain-containing protein, partial [Candidatus Limnocylindrales bacterium]|nr:molybdopterin cofactor-binding domain-containing protein [Candidatus Limnocylindrales bacterium]